MNKFVSFALAVVVWPVLVGAAGLALVVAYRVLVLSIAVMTLVFGIPITEAADSLITAALINALCFMYVVASAYIFFRSYRFFRLLRRSTDAALRE